MFQQISSISQKFFSTLSARPAAADMTTMRMFCEDLLLDVPTGHREKMLARLETMRRATDLWHLRSVLFDVIARHHGEQMARARLLELDDKLLPYASAARTG